MAAHHAQHRTAHGRTRKTCVRPRPVAIANERDVYLWCGAQAGSNACIVPRMSGAKFRVQMRTLSEGTGISGADAARCRSGCLHACDAAMRSVASARLHGMLLTLSVNNTFAPQWSNRPKPCRLSNRPKPPRLTAKTYKPARL
jgi:hypothetical protein